MKVKKVLSLALALVMIFSMIPAQLILSSANRKDLPTAQIGDATTFSTDVTLEKTGDYKDRVKVTLNMSVDYSGIDNDDYKKITTFQQAIRIDTSVLEPVTSAKSGRGTSTLADVIANASAPAYSWLKQAAGNKFALFSGDVPALDEDEEEYNASYSGNLTTLSYNPDTGMLYINLTGTNYDGVYWANENTPAPVLSTYLYVNESKQLSDVKDAIALVTADELFTDGGCRLQAIDTENSVSTGKERDRFVTNTSLNFSSDFDPVTPTYAITFTGIKNADGTAADDVVKTVNEGEIAEAPQLEGYDDGNYDYTFSSWDPATIVAAYEDATYTAQYTQQPNSKDDLQAEVTNDLAKKQADYTPETWAPFAEKLAAAQEVLANPNPTKGALATALEELVAARTNLEIVVPEYEIVFEWQNGAQRQTVNTPENEVPVVPNGAEDDYQDATTNYEFIGWEDEEGAVITTLPAATGNATYVARYNSTTRTADITFTYHDGSKTVTLPLGTTAEEVQTNAPQVPDYDSPDGSYTYTFNTWNPTIGVVSEDVVYEALYDEHENPADYQGVRDAITAAEGIMAEEDYAAKYTAESRKALQDAINEVDYTKLVGDQEAVEAMAAKIVQAKENLVVNKFTVTYSVHGQDPVEVDYDYGTEAATVEAGAPEVTPYSEGDYDYTPDGWAPDFTDVTENATYTAQYTDQFVPATLDALRTAVNDAIAKRDNGTPWSETSVNKLNSELGKADQYLNSPVEIGRSQQNAINTVKDLIDAAAAGLTTEPQPATYTIRFVDWDDTPISTAVYTDGDTVELPPDPERADSPDGNISYTFDKWTPDVVMVPTEDATYKATYKETYHYADLTALNQAIADAQAKVAAEEDIFDAKYANAASYKDAIQAAKDLAASNPLKSEEGVVNGEAQALASKELIVNTFEVTFTGMKNAQGEETEPVTRIVDYGVDPQAPVFEKYSQGDYDYNPNGWDKEVVPATENATYTAQYTPVFVEANYDDNNRAVTAAQLILGDSLSEKLFTPESLATLQAALDENVAPDLGRTAQDQVNAATQRIDDAINGLQDRIYTVTFIVENQIDPPYASGEYKYGDPLNVPQDPTKDADKTFTYTFINWGVDTLPTNVYEDATYTAQFQEVYIEYTIRFVVDGEDYVPAQHLHYGDEVVIPDAPQKDPTPSTTYSFIGWNPAVAPVTDDAVYGAQFEGRTRTYTIEFVDDDGTPLSDPQEVPYEQMPQEPPAPSKQPDETYTYDFAGWDKEVAPATEDTVYTATYNKDLRNYNIRFLVDGTEWFTETRHYGDEVELPQDPEKQPTETTIFIFLEWNPIVEEIVTGDADYEAVFEEETRYYTVYTVTLDPETAQPVTYEDFWEYNQTPELTVWWPEFIFDGLKYSFTGWDKEVVPVTEDGMIYTAQYETSQPVGPVYDITFRYADSLAQIGHEDQYATSVMQTEEGDYPNVPAIPDGFYDEEAKVAYIFDGWDKEIVPATGETTYVAQYEKIDWAEYYTINFIYADTTAEVKDGHYVNHFQQVKEDEMPNVPTPKSFTDGLTTYTFVGWNKEVVPATEDAEYTAVYKVETTFVPDMSEIDKLVEKYKQMVRTGLYEKEDLRVVEKFIDEIFAIYDRDGFENQEQVDKFATELRVLINSVRKAETPDDPQGGGDSSKTTPSGRRTSPATGDNASLVVMSVILIASIGLAVISIKKRKRDF